MSISSLLVPAILFFALGMFACLIKSDLKFPPDMHKMIVIYLLIGIGLHGGKALAGSDMGSALPAVWAALAFGCGLPIIAYIILRALGKIDPLNAAAISAHYGSVSAGTYMTAVAFLGGIGVTYEAYPVIMLAINVAIDRSSRGAFALAEALDQASVVGTREILLRIRTFEQSRVKHLWRLHAPHILA